MFEIELWQGIAAMVVVGFVFILVFCMGGGRNKGP